MNYVEIHLNDYAAATFHLTPLEDGVYWRLLRCYYRDEAPIPADVAQAARMVGARTEEEIAAVRAVLREFFVIGEDGWRQARCDAELKRFADKSEKARAAAAASWNARKANAEQSHSEGNASHLPNTHLPNTQDKKYKRSEIAAPSLASRAEALDAGPSVISIPLAGGGQHGVTAERIAYFAQNFPAVDVMAELRKMVVWCDANPTKRKTSRGVAAFIASWLSKAQDRGGASPMPVHGAAPAIAKRAAIEAHNNAVAQRYLDQFEQQQQEIDA